MKPIPIIDIEASGLHIDSYPIEIAVVVDDVVHSWLIQPAPHWQHWSERAEEMHGISRVQLETEGVAVEVVAANLVALSERSGGVFYCDAVYWDEDWLKTLFHEAKQPMTLQVKPIFDLLTEQEQQVFLQMKESLTAAGRYQLHRAAEDVRLLRDAYELLWDSKPRV
jgi:hypothetical protein